MKWTFRAFWDGACALGRREGVEAAAPTQLIKDEPLPADEHTHLDDGTIVTVEKAEWSQLLNGLDYKRLEKDSRSGRALDGAVDIAGSRPFFGGVLGVLTGWAIAGGVTGAPDIWQIIIQDASSIQCFISDMILMRQQQNAFREQLRVIAMLRSRAEAVAQCFDAMLKQGILKPQVTQNTSIKRMCSNSSSVQSDLSFESRLSRVPSIIGAITPEIDDFDVDLFADLEETAHDMAEIGDATKLEPKDFIDRVIIFIANVLGNIWMLIAFCIGIISWVALGPKYGWTDHWQLWLNTCTALQQTIACCLLTLARQRHNVYVENCMRTIFRQECELEYRARQLCDWTQPNPAVFVKSIIPDRFARGLDWYAALMGSGYGFSLSIVLLAVWLGVGDPMGWSNNWWLIIGTTTGVVGTFNAAVLRFTLQQEEYTLKKEYEHMAEEEQALFTKLGLTGACHKNYYTKTLMVRISLATSRICATRWAVSATICLILGLLIGATVVLWSETAQLLVNSVTMILESFFLIVLIDAHNIEATGHRVRLHDILIRRLQLLVIVKRLHRRSLTASKLSLDDSSQASDKSHDVSLKENPPLSPFAIAKFQTDL